MPDASMEDEEAASRPRNKVKCQADAMAALHFEGDEVPECDGEPATVVEGYELCEGCAEALAFFRELSTRVIEEQND